MTSNIKPNKESLERLLEAMPVHIEVYDSVTSTNDIAKDLVLPADKSSALIVSDHQTQGRGRLNRQFISPPAAGIYMSLLLPALPLDKLLLATPAAAVAAAEAIAQTTGITPSIKWVNDLYLEEKKIGGILTEAITDYKTGQISHLVVGIGINCSQADIPSDERNKIGSLNLPILDKNHLVSSICKKLFAIFQEISEGNTSFMENYRNLSNLIGQKITVYNSHLNQNVSMEATALNIDDNGNLVVEYADGTIEHLSSGEVSVRKY